MIVVLVKMLSLNLENAPTTFDEITNGFEIFTIATSGQRHYRITREDAAGESISYYDFYLTLSDLDEGEPVLLQIPYILNKFIDKNDTQPTPLELDRDSSEDGESLVGIFKLLYITAFELNGELFNAEVPSLIDFDKIYTLQTPDKQIKFIYYRVIGGEPMYSSYLGNAAFPGQYDNENRIIDIEERVSVVSDSGIDYYIIKVSATPNIIVSGISQDQPTPMPSESKDPVSIENYTSSELIYTLSIPTHGIQGKNFIVDLKVAQSNPPASLDLTAYANNRGLVFKSSDIITIINLILSADKATIRIYASAPITAKSVDFRIYLADDENGV